MNIRKIFSKNLSFAMKSAGLTQAQLASSAGLSQSVISDYVNEKAAVTIDSLQAAAKVLKLEPATLITDHNNIQALSVDMKQLMDVLEYCDANAMDLILKVAQNAAKSES